MALQERRSQVTLQPTRRPITASTAASHACTPFVQLWGTDVVMLCVVVVPFVVGGVGVAVGRLFTFVKM